MKWLPLALYVGLSSVSAHAQNVTGMAPASLPLSGSELVYVVQGGQPRKTAVGDLTLAISPVGPLSFQQTGTTVPVITARNNDFNLWNAPGYAPGRTNILTSWIDTLIQGSQGTGAYSYLKNFGMLTNITSTGEMAIVGGSRSSDNPNSGAGACCSIGVAGVAINDNTTHLQSVWPIYATATRLPNTGAVQLEFDIANTSNEVVDINPYVGPRPGPPGTSIVIAAQAGGEPPAVGNANGPISGILYLGPNGSFARHGIVFAANLFDPVECTTNCPAISFGQGFEIRQAFDGTDAYGSFVRFNAGTGGNGLEFQAAGAVFRNSAEIIDAVIVSGGAALNWPYVQLSATSANAIVSAGNGNGATAANLELAALGAGFIQLDQPPLFSSSVAGAGTQTFTNSPCSGLTTERWIPVQITGQTGTWYLGACQ